MSQSGDQITKDLNRVDQALLELMAKRAGVSPDELAVRIVEQALSDVRVGRSHPGDTHVFLDS